MCISLINAWRVDLSILNDCSYDTEKYRLAVEVEPPKIIELVGDYEIVGKALIFPIVGKGRCKIGLGSDNTKHNYIC